MKSLQARSPLVETVTRFFSAVRCTIAGAAAPAVRILVHLSVVLALNAISFTAALAAHAPTMHYWPNNYTRPNDRFSDPEEAGRALLDRTGFTDTTSYAFWTFHHVERVVLSAGTQYERGFWNIYYLYTNYAAGRYMEGPYTYDGVQEVFVCDPTPDADGWPKSHTIYPKRDYPNGCDQPVDLDKNFGPGVCVGNPINAAIGNKLQEEVDYAGAGPGFTRRYNSMGVQDTAYTLSRNVGMRWRHTYERVVRIFSLGTMTSGAVLRPDASVVWFNLVAGEWVPDADIKEKLQELTDGAGVRTGWKYTTDQDDVETYDASGTLTEMKSREGITKTLTYSTAATSSSIAPVPGLLIEVGDDFGRKLSFVYDSSKRIVAMTVPGGAQYTYSYDANGNLASVLDPNSFTRTYVYNETSYTAGVARSNNLTGIIDETGSRFASFGYDSAGRATSSSHSGGADQVTLTYTNHGGLGYVLSANVTDALGTSRTYGFQTKNGVNKGASVSQPCSNGCVNDASTTYDANGNVATRTDFVGNQTTYLYDLSRNLETSRTEAFGSGRARTTTTAWHSIYRTPASIAEPGRTTSFTHDSAGNVLTRTVTDTTVVPNTSRTWTYTYNSFGQVLTADGPRTDVSDVTTYTYYSCTTGYQCGQVNTITNALGHVTTYDTYNAHGQPLTITDPNGVVTTLTYDLRQRLASRTVGTELTTFDYWPTGLLKKATLPDGSYLEYTYDAAHRLTGLNDGGNNHIVYTLDAMGNRTKDETFDPTNALRQTRTRVFNTLNQLSQEIGAAGTPQVTTTFGYDNNGNQTSIAAPLSRNTGQTYDELNRLTTVTDPGAGVTTYGYDALDQLISVTDPKSLTTTYTYNGLGDLKQQVSPDTGTTTNTYDSGGNLATSTDARSAISTYTYDALNRVKTTAFKIGTTTDQTLTFNYDAGTNGKGRLTSASDASHSMGWTYDALGRVTGKSQVVSSITKAVGYGYTDGQLTAITTPSGQTITYGYTNNQITSIQVNGTYVLSNVLYEPFGPAKQWTWGNGTTSTRTYDQDGKITQIVGKGTRDYTYDDAFRITAITAPGSPSLSWTYGYDLQDRLTSAATSATTLGYSYDANGNRLSQTGTGAATYTVSSASNRVSSISGGLTRTYGYNAAGSTTTYGTNTLAYNNRGRMKSLNNGSSTTTYVYNAIGQLIQKTGALFVYDEDGHVLGQYTGSGTFSNETVWMGDIPVATLRPNSGGGVDIYYIHADHLNTPRMITRPSDNKLRWRWDSQPFGSGTPNENPESLGTFGLSLRLPGQIYFSEAGLHYNYYRDGYDPAVGRYTQSDPIGLAGGINTYSYVGGNPTGRIDPLGLQGFDPGQFPPDPMPGPRDPRTPWSPPGIPNRELCDPYYRASVDINGATYSGLIPLVSEEVVSDDGCDKSVLCTYTGQIVAWVNFGAAIAQSRETTVTHFKTRRRK